MSIAPNQTTDTTAKPKLIQAISIWPRLFFGAVLPITIALLAWILLMWSGVWTWFAGFLDSGSSVLDLMVGFFFMGFMFVACSLVTLYWVIKTAFKPWTSRTSAFYAGMRAVLIGAGIGVAAGLFALLLTAGLAR
jgi:hypothetical protein